MNMKRLQECLSNTFEKQYLIPFFWQHGEDHAWLLDELDRIEACGIREFCVESRIHNAFCEDKWWEDFGFLLQEAERRSMKVWLLDDKRFPTGYANDYLASYPELWKLSLTVEYRDYVSLGKPLALVLPEDTAMNMKQCVAIRAYRREVGMKASSCEEVVDLLDGYRNGLLYTTLPAGVWRVYYIRTTRDSLYNGCEHYIDMLSYESCHAMIDAVYEPHYQHFAPYFGTVFQGFFSDEPCFSNAFGSYESVLGTEDMLIPWSNELHERIALEAGLTMDEVLSLLPALWHDLGEKTKLLRHHYMDEATKLYQRNFVNQLGDWCREHGVQYIGHVIEDMNTHQRLGYGSGHYFRATSGQDMAGIDVVLHQIVPGFTDHEHTLPVCGKTGSPEFFDYLLGKLCISQAQMNPAMKGRGMCEIFGAYGWAEGVPLMKKLADSMFVNGINRFVPHAFDSQYPNPDCPPHFSMGGKNPQFDQFATLCEYMQRVSHLLDGGIHDVKVALFYNAEGEWNGGANMLTQRVAKILTRVHADFEIVWEDLLEDAFCDNDGLQIGGKCFKVLLLPYAEALPTKLLWNLQRLASQGADIRFVGGYTSMSVEGERLDEVWQRQYGLVLEEKLGECMRQDGFCGIDCQENLPLLRYYRYRHPDGDVYVFKNDDVFHPVDVWVTLDEIGTWRWYDAWNNRLWMTERDGKAVRVQLGEGGLGILVETERKADRIPELGAMQAVPLSNPKVLAWDKEGTPLSLTGSEHPMDDAFSDFCGKIQYVYEFELENVSPCWLGLEELGESADIAVNDIRIGSLVESPYRIDITKALRRGQNRLCVEVYTNAGYAHRDFFTSYLPLPGTGISGAVMLYR